MTMVVFQVLQHLFYLISLGDFHFAIYHFLGFLFIAHVRQTKGSECRAVLGVRSLLGVHKGTGVYRGIWS